MVLDCFTEAVDVIDFAIVFVEVGEPVTVLVMAEVKEINGELELDLLPKVDRVEVLVDVVVLLDTAEIVGTYVLNGLYVNPLVLVDVLEAMALRVGFTIGALRFLGGVDPTVPIANNNRSQRIAVSI